MRVEGSFSSADAGIANAVSAREALMTIPRNRGEVIIM
jgi:hypothetical protein